MEQLVNQWLVVEKDITLPGTEVNKMREDINARCNSECINTVQKAGVKGPSSRTKSWVHWGRNLINALCNRSALIDSGATGTFGRVQDGMIPTGVPSNKEVGMPDGRAAKASKQALLPIKKLREGARKGDILPALSDNTLISVGTLANNDYATFLAGSKRRGGL